jgi:hypothetical protein
MGHPFYWAPFAVIGEGGASAGRAAASRATVAAFRSQG